MGTYLRVIEHQVTEQNDIKSRVIRLFEMAQQIANISPPYMSLVGVGTGKKNIREVTSTKTRAWISGPKLCSTL